jgi:hypothetical protein
VPRTATGTGDVAHVPDGAGSIDPYDDDRKAGRMPALSALRPVPGIAEASTMAKITRITVTCTRQEDWTGSDDLDFYVDTTYLGRCTIGTGQTRDMDGSNGLYDAAWANEGQTITVYEDDMDPDDLVLSHTVTASDISGGLKTANTSGNCTYDFAFEFTEI